MDFQLVEESRNAVNARHQSFSCRVQALLVWVQFPKVLCKTEWLY